MSQSKEARKLLPVDKLVQVLDQYGTETRRTVEEQGMLRLGHALEAKCVELVPIDKGNLEGSSTVTVERGFSAVKAVVAFTAPYASEVHELPDEARGPRTRNKPGNEYGPAGPHYVIRPLRGFQERMSRDLGRFLQSVWGRVRRVG